MHVEPRLGFLTDEQHARLDDLALGAQQRFLRMAQDSGVPYDSRCSDNGPEEPIFHIYWYDHLQGFIGRDGVACEARWRFAGSAKGSTVDGWAPIDKLHFVRRALFHIDRYKRQIAVLEKLRDDVLSLDLEHDGFTSENIDRLAARTLVHRHQAADALRATDGNMAAAARALRALNELLLQRAEGKSG